METKQNPTLVMTSSHPTPCGERVRPFVVQSCPLVESVGELELLPLVEGVGELAVVGAVFDCGLHAAPGG